MIAVLTWLQVDFVIGVLFLLVVACAWRHRGRS